MTKKEVAEIKKLAQKKHRIESNIFVAEGFKAIEEIMSAGLEIVKIYATDNSLQSKLPRSTTYEIITSQEMERISFLQAPSNMLAIIRIPTNYEPSVISSKELTLALDNIQDPGNLGTIIRLADWFGISRIFCSFNTVDCYNTKVVQSTMGAIGRVKIIYCDLYAVLNEAQIQGIPIYGTFMEGENIYTTELSYNGVLIMGNEGSGISQSLEKLTTRKITIPSFKKENVESLNVAIATSICCSEFRRRTI